MKNLRRLACKFDLNQSERKSSQVNASARKSWPNGVARRPKFSTCGYLRLRLARALCTCYAKIACVAGRRRGSQIERFARRVFPLPLPRASFPFPSPSDASLYATQAKAKNDVDIESNQEKFSVDAKSLYSFLFTMEMTD